MTHFNTFGLTDPLVQGILATGFTVPTPIQSQAIPPALEGRDIIGCAQTGTGKTAAFVLPILNRLASQRTPGKKKRTIRSLILTPTRELAVQIERAILDYGRFLHVRPVAIYGGVKIKGQLAALRRGVDIVVATPGRLMDHMRQRTVDLKHVEVLVLDEADRMLDMGFINDVRRIVRTVPRNRQTLLFSATISPEIERLTAGIQKDPVLIQIGRPHNPIETITQHWFPVPRQQKIDLLLHMLKDGQMDSVLVFSRTKHGADKIHRRLERAGVGSVSMHSGRNQGQRKRAMDGFKRGRYQVMVATDIAARGIDIEGISHVVNFDVPAYAEDYIHRIGRTGRATATGDAITFLSPEEYKHLHQIEKLIGCQYDMETCPGFTCRPSDLSPSKSTQKSPSVPPKSRASAGKWPHARRKRPRRAAGRRTA
jgi:ATP-dependent RNA helicase RhlE